MSKKGTKINIAALAPAQDDIFARLPSAPDLNREYVDVFASPCSREEVTIFPFVY
jgi:hypothetical protein